MSEDVKTAALKEEVELKPADLAERRVSGRKRAAVDYREDKQPLFRTDSDDEDASSSASKAKKNRCGPAVTVWLQTVFPTVRWM